MSNEAHNAMTAAKTDAAFNAIKEAMPAEKRVADTLAELRHIHYDASIRKGFTPDQALVLCIKPSFT
jgi:hypothetical protein